MKFLYKLLDVKSELYDVLTSTTVEVNDGMKAYPQYILDIDGQYVGGYFCYGWSDFETLPEVDKYLSYMFYNCKNLKYLPDRINANGLIGTFSGCDSLGDISNVEFTGCYDFSLTFENCINLKTLPHIVVDIEPSYDRFTLSWMFRGCTSLVEAPTLTLPTYSYYKTDASTTYGMFEGCINLESVPEYDMWTVTGTTDMFRGCESLKHLGGLPNLRVDLSLEDSPLLTYESIMNVINGLREGFSKRLKLNAESVAKLTPEDIAIATDKGWTIAVK